MRASASKSQGHHPPLNAAHWRYTLEFDIHSSIVRVTAGWRRHDGLTSRRAVARSLRPIVERNSADFECNKRSPMMQVDIDEIQLRTDAQYSYDWLVYSHLRRNTARLRVNASLPFRGFSELTRTSTADESAVSLPSMEMDSQVRLI
jgi:hypothetical protein